MNDFVRAFDDLGLEVPDVFLPVSGVDYASWAVVACDQYSSEREYWEGVKEAIGAKPSTLNIIFPECYLEDADKAERVVKIQSAMKDYLTRGIVAEIGAGFILVERSTPFGEKPRVGLMIAVDLERYRYGADSKSLIRPTEGTIVERLPPRMQIRRGAPLELPHVMLLVDDSGRSLIEPVYARRDSLPALYDFDLMMDSGHVRGWHVCDPELLAGVAAALEKLADPEAFARKYGSSDLLLFAVGDGNHSLATAKAVWEEIKASGTVPESELARHPARHALVELVNIYDEGLPFHPIHRVLFNVDEAGFFAAVKAAGGRIAAKTARPAEAFTLVDSGATAGARSHSIGFVSSNGSGVITFEAPAARLAAGTVQGFLDPWLAANPEVGIDYIHGTESLESLAARPGNLGLYLPPVDKNSFFATVIRDGAMPRKTFSMGEAPEKRFYIEARMIVPKKAIDMNKEE